METEKPTAGGDSPSYKLIKKGNGFSAVPLFGASAEATAPLAGLCRLRRGEPRVFPDTNLPKKNRQKSVLFWCVRRGSNSEQRRRRPRFYPIRLRALVEANFALSPLCKAQRASALRCLSSSTKNTSSFLLILSFLIIAHSPKNCFIFYREYVKIEENFLKEY